MPKFLELAYPQQKKTDNEYIFGIRAVIESISAGKDFEKILIRKDLNNELSKELFQCLKGSSIPLQKVPNERLNRITRKNHQGVIGWASPIQYQNIEHIIPILYEEGKEPLIVLLDGVTDVRNFGAITRTAESVGAHAIVVPSKGSASITPDAIKTSAGALSRIPVCRTPNLVKTVAFLKNSGCSIACASEKTDAVYYNQDLSGPMALILGAEDVGISIELLKLSDVNLRIPMLGSIASLNVSVAAGVLLYEIVKQRANQS